MWQEEATEYCELLIAEKEEALGALAEKEEAITLLESCKELANDGLQAEQQAEANKLNDKITKMKEQQVRLMVCCAVLGWGVLG